MYTCIHVYVYFFEPGFSGLPRFSGLEVGGVGVRFIEGKVPFCQGILKYKLLSCKSCNPVNPGSDKKDAQDKRRGDGTPNQRYECHLKINLLIR